MRSAIKYQDKHKNEVIFVTSTTHFSKHFLQKKRLSDSSELRSAHDISPYNQPFTFTGKEKDAETGYSYFGARYMDHELMTMWLSVDPMSDKYPSLSSYAYCAWNPVKLIDPDGDSIAVLIAPNAAGHYGHMAVLIQNEKGTWDLWSENGGEHPIIGSLLNGNDAPLTKKNGSPWRFESVQDFLNDDANTEKHDGVGATYYTEALVIPTSKEQDDIIKDGMKSAMKWYSLLFNNCAQAVACSLSEAGIPIKADDCSNQSSRFYNSLYYSDKFNRLDVAVNRAICPNMMYVNIKNANSSVAYTLKSERKR